jgi:hypothetical protein
MTIPRRSVTELKIHRHVKSVRFRKVDTPSYRIKDVKVAIQEFAAQQLIEVRITDILSCTTSYATAYKYTWLGDAPKPGLEEPRQSTPDSIS